MKEIRVGIIGGGMISHRHMVIYENIQKNAELLGFTAKVVAVAEIIPERLAAWREQYGFDKKDLYTDFRELLKRDDIDTIDVCVHNNYHTPISIMAMKAGFDVYCEKPSAASYHDAKLMMDCAAKLGRKFHVQISSLMSPQTRVACDMIASGRIGTPYFVNIEQLTRRRRPGYDIPNFTSDFYSKRIAGHAAAIDLGIYVVGQILYILGQPKLQSVSGFATRGVEIDPKLITNPDGYGVEDISDGFAKFENGMGLHFLAATAMNYKDYSMTYVLGSKGGLEIINTDTVGGKFARPGMGRPAWGGEPELKFYGEMDGRHVTMELNCDENGIIEARKDPRMMMFNDNQIMWLAYKLGLLDDSTRYNTPDIALQQLLFTDGIFLSQELGRSVTADEIVAMSPTLFIPEQKIGNEIVKFDVGF
ncbi:MAG TPA: Gfo/Idh/MocA family oxidoreductase [Clostridiales bacterium]|nr:Gfo/Idh/MocA family oxidoreductase [Clostridiales bacterium]